MRKTILYFYVAFLSFAVIPAIAQDYSSNQVSQFANCLSKWTATHRAEYRFEAEDLCNGSKKAIVNDEFSHILRRKTNPNAPLQKSYELQTYLNNIEKQVNQGNINITYRDIKNVAKNEITFESKISEKDLKLTEFYTCKIRVTGTIQHESNELFYVYKNKIAKIGTYEKRQGKVVVDFDDFLNDYETIGFSYNYGKNFPIGGSLNYSLEAIPFMISVDFGINLDDDKYIVDEVKMEDIMNYERTKKELDPKFYLTVTPQFYLKYFAVGCGIGILWMDGTESSASYAYTSNSFSGENISSSTSSSIGQISTSNSSMMIKPMIRPVAKGFIPLNSDGLYLSMNISYDFIFGYKDKNGFSFGIGLQWEL